jgi:multidrug efflux pump subunit AcrA (membrane-fusion protein)
MRVVLITVTLLSLYGWASAEDRPAPVVTAAVTTAKIADGRSFVGNVEASRRSLVGSEFEGLVVEFLVREGDPVEQDQPLARLRTTVLEKRLAAARAQLALWKAGLRELENGSRPEEVQEVRARVRQAAADLDLRQWKLDAARRLHESQTISRDELREAELALRAAAERKKEAEAELALAEAGPRQERIDQAAARVQAQQAEVERLEDEMERYTIRAPFAGFVVREATEVGQWLSAGSPVAEIVALDTVDVVIPVLEDFVVGLSEQTKVAVTIGALPGKLFEGTIHRIVPKANDRARTFPVKIRVPNKETNGSVLIKAGMFARVALAVGDEVDALLVPKDALVLGMGPPFLYAVDPQTSTVRPVPIQLGIAYEDRIQVTGALKAGTRVVVRGNEGLRPGQKVLDASARKGER